MIEPGQSAITPPERAHPVRRVAGQIVAPLVDLVLPPVCAFCGTSHVTAETPAFTRQSVRLCPECVGIFLKDGRDACHRCGQPVGPHASDTTKGCVRCRPKRQRYKEVIRLGTYDDELRTACIRCKNRGAEPLAAALGDLLYCEQRERLQAIQPEVIVPVPQHWLHWFTRPHHSALTIAEQLSRRLRVPLRDGLVRKVRHTPDQSSLTRSERQKNLSRAFHVRASRRVAGQRVLVVDDILTTGSTAGEMSRALRAAGARYVAVAVIAVVR